jgi:hypothetical protein
MVKRVTYLPKPVDKVMREQADERGLTLSEYMRRIVEAAVLPTATK